MTSKRKRDTPLPGHRADLDRMSYAERCDPGQARLDRALPATPLIHARPQVGTFGALFLCGALAFEHAPDDVNRRTRPKPTKARRSEVLAEVTCESCRRQMKESAKR